MSEMRRSSRETGRDFLFRAKMPRIWGKNDLVVRRLEKDGRCSLSGEGAFNFGSVSRLLSLFVLASHVEKSSKRAGRTENVESKNILGAQNLSGFFFLPSPPRALASPFF